MMSRFDERKVLALHQSKLRLLDNAVVLFVGVNPSMRSSEPFGTESPSGALLSEFLQEVKVPVMLWNICPASSFVRNGSDVSYDDILMEHPGMLDELHVLNLKLLQTLVESSKTVKHVFALGRRPLEWLQSCSWLSPFSVSGAPHPAHFLRKQPKDKPGFLKCMRMALASICQIDARPIHTELDQSSPLWFEPLVVNFLESHWKLLELKAILKLLASHPILQGAVVAQGTVSSALFEDPTGVLISRVQKARSGDFFSIARFMEAGEIQGHTIWQFMELSPSQQQSVLSRTLVGARNVNATLQYRIKRVLGS